MTFPWRELFEHGLLPIPKLIFSDGTLTLTPLKQRLLQLTSGRVDAVSLADALQISAEQASLALETLAAVLPVDPAPAGADVHDLMLFLYVQSYKRLVPRAHKDSVAVADVWPSNSAFDGYLSALSPLQAIGVEHCESVQVISATKRICIANCRDCVFYLGVNQRPLILGDNHKLQVAPFNIRPLIRGMTPWFLVLLILMILYHILLEPLRFKLSLHLALILNNLRIFGGYL